MRSVYSLRGSVGALHIAKKLGALKSKLEPVVCI